MAYYTALIAAWNGATQPPTGVTGTALISSMTTAQKLAAVNNWAVPGPNADVPVSAVVGYLGLQGKLSGLQAFAANPPSGDTNTEAILAAKELVAIIGCPNAPDFGMSNSAYYSTIQGMLNALAADASSGITATDVTNLLALAATTVPWWQAGGYTSAISTADLGAAGGLT
jgi:hypothetical protein